MKKMTYVDALNAVIVTLEDGEVKEKIIALKTSLENKKSKKSEAEEKARKEYAEAIANLLSDGKKRTATEISKEVAEFSDFTFNKVNGIIRYAKENDYIVRKEEKGKAYFTVE